MAIKRKWVIQDLDSRALGVTASGRREMAGRLGVNAEIDVKLTGPIASKLAPTVDLQWSHD
ncbi:hypothetical protein D3C87_2135550 [compost metagenome]